MKLLLKITILLFSFTLINSNSHAESSIVSVPVGFVVHPHEGHTDAIDQYNVTAEISNVFVWRMKDKDTLEVDFDVASNWLKELYGYNRVAYPIIDTSVFHTSGWRADKTRQAGQFMVGADGKEWSFPTHSDSWQTWSSLYSPLFRKDVLQYADQLVDWVKENDPDFKIRGYINGAEWFMPATVDYNKLGIADFQNWLENKYGSLEYLNEQWGSDYAELGKVDPPRGHLLGDSYVGMRTVGFGFKAEEVGCYYVSQLFSVEADSIYYITADVYQENSPRGLYGIKLDCYDDNNRKIEASGDGQFYWPDIPNNRKGKLSAYCRVPSNAVNARLKLKLMAPGTVHYINPSISKWPKQHNLLSNDLDIMSLWSFSTSSDRAKGKVKQDDNSRTFILNVDSLPMPFTYSGLAWDDWITFSYESMAQWLNTCAKHIKERDPNRKIVSYNGCVFGTHTLGDFTTYWQRLDISLANSPEIDVYGIQVCIADKDYTMVTCPLDITRKYGKQIYLTDIVDFPYGLFSGFESIYRGTLRAIQHGADGVFAYCWLDSVAGTDYQFYKHMSRPELKKYIDDTKTAIDRVSGLNLHTEAAFLLPIMPYSLDDKGGYKSDWLDIGGWVQLLNDLGIVTDMYTPYELMQRSWDLRKYKVIILPDCPILPEEVNLILTQYVKDGGSILLSGRTPSKDLRNNIFPSRLVDAFSNKTFVADLFTTNLADENTPCHEIIDAVRNPTEKVLGQGKVFWINEKLGKAYWGQARRKRVYGNTPPTYIKPHYTQTAQMLRESIRSSVDQQLARIMDDQLVNFDSKKGSVSLSSYLKHPDKYETATFFLINNGQGRHKPIELRFSQKLANKSCRIWTDFDRHLDKTVDSGGRLEVPDFAHIAFVTFK